MLRFGTPQPRLTNQEALRAKPVRLVDADITHDGAGGGMLRVTLEQPRWGRLLFRLPAGATKAFELDAIGLFVWEAIDGRTSVEQIIRRLAQRYDLNLREAQVPTLTFLQTLMKKGLVGVHIETDKSGAT